MATPLPTAYAGTRGVRTHRAATLTVILTAITAIGCSSGTGSGNANDNGGGTASPQPTLSFTATPSTIANSASSTLAWSSTNAASCAASGGWSGAKSTGGSEGTGALTGTRTYMLTCTGAGGSVTRSATVTVTAPSLPPVVSGNTLAQTAAAMQPGEWRELVTTNLEPTLNQPTCGATGSIFPYSEDAVWDPVSRRVYFIGSDHIYIGTCPGLIGQRFISYSEDNNSWGALPNPPWFAPTVAHGYDHSAIDVSNGIYFHFPYGNSQRPLHRYQINTGTWLTDTPAAPDNTCCAGVECFPEFVGSNTSVAAGGVVLAGSGNVYAYRAATNSWTGPLNSSRLNFGDYHTVAEYNPVHKVTIFGGGENFNPAQSFSTLYKLAPNGGITALAPAPFNLRVNLSIVTVDPVSGDYLVFGPNGEFYVYNVLDNTWTLQATIPPFASPKRDSSVTTVDLTVAAPISTNGVVMFVKHIPGNAPQTKVYLYKHKALVGGVAMPSAADEKTTYQKWNWTWNASAEPAAVTEPIASYTVTAPDIHGDTEGDDLWTHLMMYRRSGNPVYLNRAQAWANYFKQSYRTACAASDDRTFCYDHNQFGADHLFGWGLIAWYEHTCLSGNCDQAALTEAENLGAVVEALYGPSSTFGCLPTNACLHYGLRQASRHLLLATRLAEVTRANRWIALRDRILDLMLAAGSWDGTRGMYFVGSEQTNSTLGPGAYAAGYRIQSPFQVGVLAEAFSQAYRTTGRAALRDRLVAIAEFVYQHGSDPVYQYTGSSFGLYNGQTFHSNNPTQSTTLDCSATGPRWDPVYSTSLVNTLLMGYRFTGERRYYDQAKLFFNRGTKGVYNGTACDRTAADNVAHHFVDTRFSSANGYFYFDYNKGELQYTYLLFENGGLAP